MRGRDKVSESKEKRQDQVKSREKHINTMKNGVHKQQSPRQERFGTFGGVFTPSVLTIIGVIMFLRFPAVVGTSGLWGALFILFIAKMITLSTALSVSSITTNMQARGGGAYYLISRSLGVEFGGMIALFFYGAQAVAVSIYVFGFTEVLFSAVPDIGISFILAATIVNILVFLCVYIGAGWTIRIQYGILAIIALSIVSFLTGALQNASAATFLANLAPAWTDHRVFFSMFALFFPAVTGIMAGVNMSGDLKDPSRSIPRGTLAAVGITALVYASVAIMLAASNGRSVLLGQDFVMKDTAVFGVLVYAGVICATLSSAMGSMMGAPRILQAFANDNVFPRIKWMGKGSGVLNEPRRAIIVTFFVAQAGIMTGSLDNVAPIITMFFLITYGTVNLACFYEIISRNPSFRPTFKFNHWGIALAGALGCLIVMFMLDAIWAFVAVVSVIGIYALIARAEIVVQWGDLRSGLAFQSARKALLRLQKEIYHPKNWRPSILTLSGGAWNRLNLVKYACLLSAKRGMVSLAQVITGDLEDRFTRQIESEKIMRQFIREEELAAFPVVVVDESFEEGLKALFQCHGIGEMKPNTLLLGWSEDRERRGTFFTILSLAKKMKRSLLIVKCRQKEGSWNIPSGAINIWWNDPANGPLMLMMGFLLRENLEWRDCPLRVLRTVPVNADTKNVDLEMNKILSDARINAEVVVLPTYDPLSSVREAMIPSAVLFAGFEPGDDDSEQTSISSLEDTVNLPGDVILVYSAGSVSLTA
jgi:amino acid transporter